MDASVLMNFVFKSLKMSSVPYQCVQYILKMRYAHVS